MNNLDNTFADRIKTFLNGSNLYVSIIFIASLALFIGGLIYGSFILHGFAVAFNAIAWLIKIATYLRCITMAQVEQVTYME